MTTLSSRFTSGPSELYAFQNEIVVVFCAPVMRAPAVAAVTATIVPSTRTTNKRLRRIVNLTSLEELLVGRRRSCPATRPAGAVRVVLSGDLPFGRRDGLESRAN